MKRYLVYCGQTYYPGGGWNDYHTSYDDPEAAKAYARGFVRGHGCLAWAHVVDTEVVDASSAEKPEIIAKYDDETEGKV